MTNNQTNQNSSEDPDIFDSLLLLWSEKSKIIKITLIFTIFSFGIILFSPQKFTSSALLSPVDDSTFSAGLGAYAGLATMAGIDLGAPATSKTDIAILESYGFTSMALRSNPPIKDRVATVQAMLENSKGRVRMEIHASCRRLIECLELQSYDERTGDPDKQNGYDHMNDALGYLIYREFNKLYFRVY